MSMDIRVYFENNPSGIFYAGQLLSGTVNLTLREEKKVRGVYIRIYGKAYCRWTRSRGKSSVTYIGEENYINKTIYLVGSAEGNVKLPPGTQSYNFQCSLPNELPTSVEGNIGYIRYTACVTVDVPMGFDKELKQRFTVIRPLNLNRNQELRRPVISANSEMGCCSVFFCCFCICMNPIEVAAKIPVAGYTSGQHINLQLYVTHKGSPKTYEFSVKLMKRIDYRTNKLDRLKIDYYSNNISSFNCCDSGGHNKETQCITESEASCRISNTTSDEIVRVNLRVPPVPPTDYSSSKVVKVTYYLSITTSTGCCNGSPKNIIPLTIGTYPIEDFVTPSSNGTAPPVPDTPTAPLPDSASGNSGDGELPTYEEALDMVDGGGGDTFKPKYPVFKRRTSYSTGHWMASF